MRTSRLRAAVAFAALAAALTACGASPGGASPGGASPGDGSGQAGQSGVIVVNNTSCGGDWHLAGPGWHTFKIRNSGTDGGEIDLVDPANGAVYDEVDETGPGTTTPMSLDVGSGKYAFLCLFDDFSPLTGQTVTVPGHVRGMQPILPVTYNDLIPIGKEYQQYAENGLKVLARQTGTLAADVRDGNLAAARRDWLTAHLQYQTLGAAYDDFGPYDDEIDGRADAVGVNSPRWTGFYRLEYGLWHGQSAARLEPVAQTLNNDVHALLAWWPSQELTLLNIGLRTHEILENALEFQLTGHDDYGSGTTLATTLANIQGTRVLLGMLRPLLVPRYPALPSVYTGLNLLQALLEKEHLRNGQWVPVSALTTATRQRIDAACGQVLQELAPIASITEPRNTQNEF